VAALIDGATEGRPDLRRDVRELAAAYDDPAFWKFLEGSPPGDRTITLMYWVDGVRRVRRGGLCYFCDEESVCVRFCRDEELVHCPSLCGRCATLDDAEVVRRVGRGVMPFVPPTAVIGLKVGEVVVVPRDRPLRRCKDCGGYRPDCCGITCTCSLATRHTPQAGHQASTGSLLDRAIIPRGGAECLS
jgi:hypothetical protein